VADFSAVAYSFGRMLADSLKVPVGLICNAVGGAPAEAFLDRQSVENHHQLVDLLYSWTQNDMIQDWVRGRAVLNMKASNVKWQRHPYEPCYLYETAIKPLEEFALKGCIWYQGESNAHNIELHETIFPTLVSSWRKNWGEQMPFYFVQLSSINRPSWPHFRDSQRRLAEKIEYCDMAVSSDLGHPTDVHPTQKKAIGERLARLALKGTYGYEHLIPAGPMFKGVVFKKEIAWVEFENAQGIKSLNDMLLVGFELAGEDGIFYPATAVVEGMRVKVSSSQVSRPCRVRYGWKPYFIGNLINGAGLPASTFSSEK
jgi:sialate O-acetylesterase